MIVFAATAIRAGDDNDARAIVDKAIKAMGGDAELGKWKAFTSKIKGDIHTQGVKIAFTGELATQGADQEKISLDLNIDGQTFPIVQVLNRDRGWVKIAGETVDMDREKLAETLEEAHAGWVASLVPLKDKAFTLATVGEAQVEGKPALGVRVSHAGRRDVNLYFDNTTHLLVKSETRVKDDESGKEMTEETFLHGYDGKDVQTALKLTVKRDGEPYLEAELFDVKLEEKLDDSVFAKP
jgi:hypothetical protein